MSPAQRRLALIEIDAPPANALGTAIRRRFLAELDAIERDTDVRALVITGRGNAFCSGDDLKEAAERGEGALESLDQFAASMKPSRPCACRSSPPSTAGAWRRAGTGPGLRHPPGLQRRQLHVLGVNVGLIASAYRLPR